MKLKLNIDEIQLIYDAVNHCQEISTIATEILQILDVEHFADEYELIFENDQFENLRLATREHTKEVINIKIKATYETLNAKLLEVRKTLI